MKPNVALVQGDASGIGPELLAKLLTLAEVRDAANILIVGDQHVLERAMALAAEIKGDNSHDQ